MQNNNALRRLFGAGRRTAANSQSTIQIIYAIICTDVVKADQTITFMYQIASTVHGNV
jgi:hypothetical protein